MNLLTPTLILLTAGCLLTTPAFAQLYMTFDEIIEKYGAEDTRYDHDDGSFTIAYSEEAETEASGVHERVRAFTFKKLNTDMYCVSWRILEPSSEINSNVKMLNRKYVKTGKMTWKDYEQGVLYTVELSDNICILYIAPDTSD